MSKLQKDYMKYVKKKLKKHKVDTPDQIPDKKKRKFYKDLDKGWKSKKELKKSEDENLWVKEVQEKVKEKQKKEKEKKPVVKIESIKKAVREIISYKPPKGLFKEPGTQIAKQLLHDSKSPQQAMQRLNFYINRAGSNLDDLDKKHLEEAKDIISKAVSDKKAVTKIAPKQPPKGWWNKMKNTIKKKNPSYNKETVDKIVGDIWYNKLSPSKKKEVTQEHES